jgi:Tol biopolymer transport system component
MLASLALALLPPAPAQPLQDPRFVERKLNGPLVQGIVGEVTTVAASPDGAHVAYVVWRPGSRLEVVRSDGSLPATPLAGGDDVFLWTFGWAGDDHLAYVSERADGARRLRAVPIDGGAPPAVLDAGNAPVERVNDVWFRTAAGGARVVFAGGAFDIPRDLYAAPVDGSAPAAVLSPTATAGRYVAQYEIGPDGTRVVFRAGQDFRWNVYSAPVDGSAPAVQLSPPVSGPQGAFDLAIEPGGTRVAFSMGESGIPRAVFAAPIDGSAPAQLLAGPFSVARVGDLRVVGADVVYQSDQNVAGRHELFRVPLDGSAPPELLAPVASGSILGVRAVTADERWILYHLRRDGGTEALYSVRADGSAPPVELVQFLYSFEGMAPTSDSTTVVFSQPPLGTLKARPIDGSAPATEISGPLVSGGTVSDFELAPDGQQVVYLADAAVDGVPELFRAPVHPPGGTAAPVRLIPPLVPGQDVGALWLAPDGTRVFFTGRLLSSHRELYACPFGGTTSPLHLNGSLPIDAVGEVFEALSAGGTTVYRADEDADDVYGLYGVPSDGRSPAVPLGPALDANGGFELSPDGRFVVTEVPGERLFAMPTDGSTPAFELTSAATGPYAAGIEIGPDSARVVFRAGVSPLRWFTAPLPGGAPVFLCEPQGATPLRFSPDSARVVFAGGGLSVVPADGSAPPLQLAAGAITQFAAGATHALYLSPASAPPVRLLAVPYAGGPPVVLDPPPVAGGNVTHLTLSPDGTWAVFRADAATDERFQLYARRTDGSGSARVLNGPLPARGDVVSWAITPDGTRVVYVADEATNELFNPYSVPLTVAGPSVRLTASEVSLQSNPGFAIAPDSTRVLVATDYWLRAIPIAGGDPVQLTPATFLPGIAFGFTGDGERVVARTAAGFESFSLRDGTSLLMKEPALVAWHVSGNALVYLQGDDWPDLVPEQEVFSISPRKTAPAGPPR